jgi:hypothetical protein
VALYHWYNRLADDTAGYIPYGQGKVTPPHLASVVSLDPRGLD